MNDRIYSENLLKDAVVDVRLDELAGEIKELSREETDTGYA